MTNKEYRQAPGISRSELQLFRKSPAHYEYQKEQTESKTTPALIFGSAAHKYILEKDSFFDEYIVAPNVDRRTAEGKKIYAEFLEKAEGKCVISTEDYMQLIEMYAAIDRVPLARQLLTGDVEQSYFWVDEETGEQVKCRPDVLTEYEGKKYIVDYKTTDSCENGHFERSAKKYGYQLQAGMYREGMFQCKYEDYGFAFVAQEKSAPYCVRVYICTDDYIETGYDEYRALLGLYHKCKESGTYPGYEGFEGEVEYLTERE
ncbi:MAG: PD-(D/E)XK nuclease-like domain-containing protein [Bacteroidales bacterium]|nr:PD-(D/E)XK nuclease-like domain-containing protein [Bacteroidales bacterium]